MEGASDQAPKVCNESSAKTEGNGLQRGTKSSGPRKEYQENMLLTTSIQGTWCGYGKDV